MRDIGLLSFLGFVALLDVSMDRSGTWEDDKSKFSTSVVSIWMAAEEGTSDIMILDCNKNKHYLKKMFVRKLVVSHK
jgi:hypothetical protein